MQIEEDLKQLYEKIVILIREAKQRVAVSANSEVTLLNWKIGVYVQEYILQGSRAEYGKQIIKNLSVKLTENMGSGWSEKHIRHCLRAAEAFTDKQIVSTVQRQLSWTHIKAIAYENDPLKRDFYLEMAISQQWNTRTLSEQMNKMLYERTTIAQKPEEQIEKALTELKGNEVINPDLFFKNTYILDFLGLRHTYSEKDLEDALVANLERFILELGKGFAFIEGKNA